MYAKDVFWGIFEQTGTIGPYLLLKQIENEEEYDLSLSMLADEE